MEEGLTDYRCPDHFKHGLTPHDERCHNHASAVQQICHNAHCRLLGCPRALSGIQRHKDGVSLIGPRNLIETALLIYGDSLFHLIFPEEGS